MKNLFILISSILVSFSLYASDLTPDQVPSDVQNTITKNYKNIRDLSWEKDGRNYQAEFKVDLKEYEVIMNEKGKILAVYQDISINELPDKVRKTIQSNYSNYKIEDVENLKVKSIDYYKIELESSDGEMKIFINSKGEIVKAPLIK